MINCEDTPQAIQAAKDKAVSEARQAAVEAGLDPNVASGHLLSLIGPLLDQGGSKQRRELVDAYLPAALSETARRQQANGVSGSASNPLGASATAASPLNGGPALSTPWWANGVGRKPAGPLSLGALDNRLAPPGGWGSPDSGFFSSVRPPPGSDGSTGSNQPGVAWGSIPSSYNGEVEDDSVNPLSPDSEDYGLPSPVLPGIPVSPGELQDYYGGVTGCNDSQFVIANWIHPEDDPPLIMDTLAYAKQMHASIIVPIAQHYRTQLYGDPAASPCLVNIKYGVTSAPFARKRLGVGPMSRKLVNQTVNFQVFGVRDEVVIEDLANRRIDGVRVGTFGLTNGVHASLPFYVGGELVEGLLLYKDLSVPGYIGYDWR